MTTKRWLVLTGAILIFLILCLGGAAAGIDYLLRPVDTAAAGETLSIEIEPGAAAAQIAADLAEKGLIHNALLFQLYARRHGLDQKFMAGTYELKPSMSLAEIAAKIASGEVEHETSWFTVPEGYTIEQIAGRLAAAGVVDRQLFLEQAAHPPAKLLNQFSFLKEAAKKPQLKYLLEGYLFPDTYELAAGISEEEIITLMLRRFAAIFNETRQQRCAELGLTLHEVLTLASIVEGETRVEHERERIAGVFHNRLERNWLLGSCATVQYIIPERKENLTIADTQTPSPYNTYLHPGLPPGPVGAPGEASIQASLYPETTDYLFFVSKGDGTGEHYFSRTNAEHESYKKIVGSK